MVSSRTHEGFFLKNSECKKVVLDWFENLSERNIICNGVKVNGRAWRAEIKRAEVPYGPMLCEGYSELCHSLGKIIQLKEIDKMALSLFACVVVHVKKNNDENNISFPAQLGEKLNKSTACILPGRFKRLLYARSPDDLCRQLMQVVKIRGQDGCNVFSLVDCIFIWMHEWDDRMNDRPESDNPFKRSRISWAADYYSCLK